MAKIFFKILKYNWLFILILFVYTFIVTFFCSKMSPFYPIQEWSDVNLYFNIGKAVMHGQTIYLETFDHKGPLIFFIYGLGYLISNTNFFGIFCIQFLIWFITTFCVFFIAKLNFTKRISLIISALFLLLYISHTSQGGSAEEFITCCMMISLLFFVKSFSETDRVQPPIYMFIHGLMWAIVLFIKFNLVIFWFVPLLIVFLILLARRMYLSFFYNALCFLLGVMAVTLPILIYFISNNALKVALDSYFLLNSTSQEFQLFDLLNKVFVSFYQRIRFETIEFTIILIGAFIYPFIQFKSNIAKFLFPFSFLSLFTLIFMGGYVYYYSIPYYIYAVLGIISILMILKRLLVIDTISVKATSIILFLLLAISVWRKDFFEKYNADLQNKGNVIEAFLPYIKGEKDKSLVNLGLDDANALFTYADIIPNVKYFIAPNLPHERFSELRNEQEQYIKDKKTNFVVLAEYTNNALYFSQLPELAENYELIAEFQEYYEWHKVNRFYYLYKRK